MDLPLQLSKEKVESWLKISGHETGSEGRKTLITKVNKNKKMLNDALSYDELSKPLLQASIDEAEQLGIGWDKVDSSPDQRSLYDDPAPAGNLCYSGQDIHETQFTLFRIESVKIPKVVDKTQRRSKKHGESEPFSQQRLDKKQAEVILKLVFFGPAQPMNIEVNVQRTAEALRKLNDPRYQFQVPLPLYNKKDTGDTCQFTVDLDAYYEYNGKIIYSLAKNQTEEVNRFELAVTVTFLDGVKCTALTPSFLVKGKAQKPASNAPADGNVKAVKRPRTETDESCGSASTCSEANVSYQDISNLSPNFSPSEQSPVDDNIIDTGYLSNISTDVLYAQLAMIDELILVRPIRTANGDIAYHFTLKDPYSHPQFEAGQCIGFFMDKLGSTVIDKLTPSNYNDAFLKGVITRNQYIEGMKPETDDVRTETICMFGIIPVQVVGSVRYMDRLVAAPQYPGIAIAERTLKEENLSLDSSTFCNAIGFAMQSVDPYYKKEINLVTSFVSIMVGMEGRIMDEVKNSTISSLKNIWRKQKRCRYAAYSIFFVLLLLVSIFLWQLYTPGTAYRYWQCERGYIKGSTATFSYVPQHDLFVRPVIHGIQFKHDVLEKKMKFGTKAINRNGVRYYLNLDRCAYGGLRKTTDRHLGLKTVYGPNVFAINATCDPYVWYFHDRYDKWVPYQSAREVKCSS